MNVTVIPMRKGSAYANQQEHRIYLDLGDPWHALAQRDYIDLTINPVCLIEPIELDVTAPELMAGDIASARRNLTAYARAFGTGAADRTVEALRWYWILRQAGLIDRRYGWMIDHHVRLGAPADIIQMRFYVALRDMGWFRP